jgi:elongation factor P hydroxylase
MLPRMLNHWASPSIPEKARFSMQNMTWILCVMAVFKFFFSCSLSLSVFPLPSFSYLTFQSSIYIQKRNITNTVLWIITK